MKKILTLIALSTFSRALDLNAAKRTKYICSLGGITTVEFSTKKECLKSCFQPGVAAVCEETGVNTDVEDTANIY
jgi:hypothetical protein